MKNYLALILCLLGSCLWAQRIVNLNEENATHSLQSSRQNVPAGYLKNAKASRAFTVNKALQSQQNTKAGDVIALQLFEGKSYNARISSVTTDVNNVLIITAKIIDYPMGYAIITTDKGTNKTSFTLGIPELNEYYTSAGNINSAATYLIELDKNNLNEISGVKNDDVVIPVSETKQQGKIPSLNTQAASKGVNDHANIDVMIVYTQDAETWANANKNGINNYLSTLMAYSNNVLSNSVAYASMTLVHSRKVSYTSVGGDLGTDLTRLRTMGDGYLDEVHTLRDQYAADLVSFIEKSDQLDLPGNGTCGLAYRLTNGNPTGNDTLGFSVIKTTDDFSNNTYCHESTFIHEIGHNIGMAHDAETSGDLSGNIIYPYAYGWRWTGNDGNKYRSIMSYNKGGETRVPYYSDPSVSHQGKPTGNASTANNALVFRNIKHYVAAYRENPTGLMAPGGLSVSAITGNGATLKWNAVSGATSYKVEYKTSAATSYSSVTVTTNTRVLTGLTSSTVYNWRVTAINAGGSSSATSGTNFTTLVAAPSAPSGLAVSAITGNGATLKWNAVSGATSYKVEYKTSASTSYSSVTVTTNTRVLTGLAASTVYNWRVTAINAGGNSSIVSGTNFTTLAGTPSAPSGLAVSALTGNGATLKWNAVSGATSYKVEYKTSAATAYTSVTVTTNTRVLTGLASNTVYNWRVTAINAGGSSSATSGTNFTTLVAAPSAPSGLAVSAITGNGATLKWNAVIGATSYKAEYKTSVSASYSSVTVTTNTRVLTGLASSTVYNWRVTAINAGGSSSAVSGTNFTTLAGTPSAPSAPSGLAVSAITGNGATLKWNAVSGATSYKVEYKTSASASYSSVTVTTNTRVLTGLASSTVYNWRVTAINAGGSSSAVSGTNFTTLAGTPSAPSAPSGLAVSAITGNGATLKWNAVSGATSYKVEYKTSASTSYSSVTVTTNSRVLTGLASNTVYNWRVTAINAGGNSSAVSGTNFTTLAGTPSAPSAPSGLAVSAITSNGATLKWNAVSGATSYKVEYKTSASTSYSSVTVTTNSRVLTGLASNTVYNWRVTAINAGGNSSAVSGTNFTTLAGTPSAPSAPSGLAVSAITSNGATLKWNAVSGATSYKVEYKTSASTSYSSVTVTTNSRVLTGLASNTVYNWRVTAINAGGNSSIVSGTNFTTLVAAPSTPSGLSVSAITGNGATLKWNAVSGATSYKVEYKTSAATAYTSVMVTTNTRVLTGLVSSTVYNWRVTAINAGGSSVVANGANFTTAPPAPSGLNVSGITLSGATLAWNAVSGASSYKLEYKTSAATTYSSINLTTTSRALTGLPSNTTYNWRVSAINAGGSSTVATGSNFTTLVSAPSGLNVSGVTLSGATLAWNAVIGASSYRLEYKTSSASTYSVINLTTTSRALTGLPSNTTYNWRVSAINAGGSSTIATGSNFTTLVSAPSGLNVSGVTLSGATLAWNAVSGASSYKVEYKTSAATTYTTMTVTSATRVLTGLLSNTTYNWRVSAINGGGSSTVATGSNFTTLVSAPNGLNVSGVTLSGATLAWNAVIGASSYKLEYKTSAATTYSSINLTTTSRALTGLPSNTTYNWRVSAINAGGSSTIATGSNFTTLVSAPSGLNVSGITLSGATLAWNAVSGASSYKLEYKTSAATTYSSINLTTTSRALTGLPSNTTYNWRVSAINAGGSSTVATGSNFTTLVSAPSGLNVSGVTLSGATLAWNAVIGASSYRLEYKTSSASTYSVINLTTTSRALTGLPSNTTYNWRVSAINAGGSSTIATGSNFTTLVSAPSGLNVSGVTLSGATLAWNAVSGASSYKVEYKTSAATTYTTMTVTSATRALTGLLSNTTYNWRVSAINGGGSSTVATGSNFTTLVSAPNGLNVSGVTLSGATLAWNAVIGASSYKLEYKTSAATTYSSINLTTTSRALTGLPSNTTYNWRVSAINAGGSSTIATGSNFTTLVSAPSGLNVSGITLSGATLAWNAVSGASSYRLEYKTSSASTYSVINLTTTSRALTGLPSNTTYNWRVSAINAGGSSTVATGPNFTPVATTSRDLDIKSETVVSTLQKKTADLYPNPAHDILYIRGLGNSGERTAVVIYNLSGQVVKTINVILEDKIRIDVSTLPESNYILIIKGNKFNFIKR